MSAAFSLRFVNGRTAPRARCVPLPGRDEDQAQDLERLLGTNQHAKAGLMRARWSHQELRRSVAADWRFSLPLL